MGRNEELYFKLFDRECKEGRKILHAAFFDSTQPDANLRDSYEIRTVSFWKQSLKCEHLYYNSFGYRYILVVR